jgi:hypothetical protein
MEKDLCEAFSVRHRVRYIFTTCFHRPSPWPTTNLERSPRDLSITITSSTKGTKENHNAEVATTQDTPLHWLNAYTALAQQNTYSPVHYAINQLPGTLHLPCCQKVLVGKQSVRTGESRCSLRHG